jgi:antitoxin component HigA of HigAB toxin-antitoxin module
MATGSKAPESYAALLAEAQPRSITNDAEAAAIQARIDRLIDKPEHTADEDALLSLLGDLLLAWEGDRYDLLAPTPAEAIRALLDAHGYEQQDLVGPVFATKSIASEVLHGKRGLTYAHVGRLARFFHVAPTVFYQGV